MYNLDKVKTTEQDEITDSNKEDVKMKTWKNPIYGDDRDKKGYDRTDPSQRHKRRMEDVLAKGRPSEQLRLNRERNIGTPISELFHKAKR